MGGKAFGKLKPAQTLLALVILRARVNTENPQIWMLPQHITATMPVKINLGSRKSVRAIANSTGCTALRTVACSFFLRLITSMGVLEWVVRT